MQIRCKLLNEFAIRNRGCQVRAAPAGFMNGPAWGGGGGGAPPRPPRFPAAAPATCRAARCCLPAPPRPGPPPAGQLLRTGRGRLPARVPTAPPAATRRAETRLLGPGRGLPAGVPFLGYWNGFLKQEGVKIAFRPCSLRMGSPGRSLTTGGGGPLTWRGWRWGWGNDLGKAECIMYSERRGDGPVPIPELPAPPQSSSCQFPPS